MTKTAPYNKDFVQFIPYLKEIDIVTRTLITRVEHIYTLCTNMCPEKIEDIFVTDYIKEDGTREYENLWFFSKGYCLEAKKFLSQIDLDITPLPNRINYWTVTIQDFDFKKASEKSRLTLQFRTVQEIHGDYKAAKRNCDYLNMIINKYIKPNQVLL